MVLLCQSSPVCGTRSQSDYALCSTAALNAGGDHSKRRRESRSEKERVKVSVVGRPARVGWPNVCGGW